VSFAACIIRSMYRRDAYVRRALSRTVTVTDLFSGAGGSSEGLRQAGCVISCCANHNPLAVATHQKNHPGTEHRIANLSEVDWRTFPATDILWASPSCKWQAPAGGRARPSVEVELRRDDPGSIDRATAFAVVAAAEVHRYPVIFVENVPAFQSWTLFQWWLDGLAALGYARQIRILDSVNFGLPQRRPRFYAIFTQLGIEVDLTPAESVPVHAAAILDDHPVQLVQRRLYVTPQIEQITDREVPHLVTYRRNARARRTDLYPLATVSAGGNHHGLAVVDRSGQAWHRMLTNRECARGQGFPDGYEFLGTDVEVKRQIGNAVPVAVAKWLGGRACDALAA
jgi:DNA (cytosine-5)-methyltransferase 1